MAAGRDGSPGTGTAELVVLDVFWADPASRHAPRGRSSEPPQRSHRRNPLAVPGRPAVPQRPTRYSAPGATCNPRNTADKNAADLGYGGVISGRWVSTWVSWSLIFSGRMAPDLEPPIEIEPMTYALRVLRDSCSRTFGYRQNVVQRPASRIPTGL